MTSDSVRVIETYATVTAWDGERGTVEPHIGPHVALLTAVTVKAGGQPVSHVKVGAVLRCEIVVVDAPEYANVVRVLDIIVGLSVNVVAPPRPETPDDGGPAYPVPGPTELPSNGIITDPCPGMTLRDRFAIAALATGELFDARDLGPIPNNEFRIEAERIAACCYSIADAMLAARRGA